MIEIGPISTREEFESAVELQKAIWGFAEVDLMPVRAFIVATKIGGQAFGAFHGGRMIGFSLAIPDAGGAGCVATLLPLERGERRNVLAPFAAAVAVFVQESAQIPMMPGEAFAKLYGLTGGELRVLLALAQGLGGKEAADMLGVSEPTVRTHLQRIFSKTGTSRQAELLQLLQSSAPPTKAA